MMRLALLGALLSLPATGRASCFEGQLPQAAWAAAAGASALKLVLMQGDGRPGATASGMVVAGSGAPDRVLTAGQVVRDAARAAGGWIAAWSSSGAYLGRLESAAEVGARPVVGLSARSVPSGARAADVAVLRIAQFSADGARLYEAIPGLSLAPRQPAGLLAAEVDDPAGVDAAASGAGVVGSDGRLLGVLSAQAPGAAAMRVQVRAGLRTVRLPAQSLAYAVPLTDPALLAALGDAGGGIARARAPLRFRTTIPAYAAGACVVFRAVMEPG